MNLIVPLGVGVVGGAASAAGALLLGAGVILAAGAYAIGGFVSALLGAVAVVAHDSADTRYRARKFSDVKANE